MKNLFFILLCFSQIIFTQHKRKNVEEVSSAQQYDPSFSSDKLLNDFLKGSKWNFDLKEFDNSQILLDKNKIKPDVLYFVDARNFQININQKNCEGIIKGTYQIVKETEGIAVTLGKRPFKVVSATNQKCIDRLVFFLERNLEVFFDEDESVIEIKEYEFLPAIFMSK